MKKWMFYLFFIALFSCTVQPDQHEALTEMSRGLYNAQQKFVKDLSNSPDPAIRVASELEQNLMFAQECQSLIEQLDKLLNTQLQSDQSKKAWQLELDYCASILSILEHNLPVDVNSKATLNTDFTENRSTQELQETKMQLLLICNMMLIQNQEILTQTFDHPKHKLDSCLTVFSSYSTISPLV